MYYFEIRASSILSLGLWKICYRRSCARITTLTNTLTILMPDLES